MWSWIIPILTFIVGLVGGAFIGFQLFKKQMMNVMNNPSGIAEMMRANPGMLEKMGKQMGASSAQLKQAQKMMNRKSK